MSQHFYPGTAVTGDRAAAATVQGAPCFTDAGQPSVVVLIQCSLIPCRSRQAPVIQRGRVRASIAFMYPRPRKHRLCIHTPRLPGLCPGTLCPTGAARRPRQGSQEPPGAAPISFQDPRQGFPCLCCWRPGTGPHRRPGGRLDATHGPGWRLISAAAAAPDLRTQLQPVRPAAARRAGYSYMYTYTDGLKHGYRVFA